MSTPEIRLLDVQMPCECLARRAAGEVMACCGLRHLPPAQAWIVYADDAGRAFRAEIAWSN